jgi:Ca2+-binding RTX toxin-like protein
MWTDSSGNLHLQDTTDPTHSIVVDADTTGSGTHESTIGTYLEQVKFDDVGNTTWDLTGGLTLTNTDSGGSLYGTAYGDTLIGGTGGDTLYGNNGNDTLVSGGGTDSLQGGPGDDTYVFAPGFGNATVIESLSSGADTIHFSGIDPADIRMYTDTSGNLHLQDTTNPSYNITVDADQTGSGFHESTVGSFVESVTFDSAYATTWDLTGGLTLTNTNSGGSLYGTAYGDILIGGTGGDTLYGNAGNDTLVSGGGTDSLQGGTGDDTYVFASGFGNATVIENLSSGSDTIHFSGIDPADIRMYTDSSGNLHFQDAANPSYNITVDADQTGSGFHESAIGSYVESVTFDSAYATTWDLTGGLTLTAPGGGGTLYGTGNGDTLNGSSSGDTIYANAGNNMISGNGGNDSINLGAGADTVLFKAASAETGVDTISNFDTGKGDKLDIADMLSLYDPATDPLQTAINNFVELNTSGGNTQVKVDMDGSGTSYTQIATLSGVTGLNLHDLITDGNLIVHHT